jgi:hypothetical protein
MMGFTEDWPTDKALRQLTKQEKNQASAMLRMILAPKTAKGEL